MSRRNRRTVKKAFIERMKAVKFMYSVNGKKLTQAQIAKVIKSQSSHVARVLNSETNELLTIEQLIDLSQYLQVSVDWLLGIDCIDNESYEKNERELKPFVEEIHRRQEYFESHVTGGREEHVE